MMLLLLPIVFAGALLTYRVSLEALRHLRFDSPQFPALVVALLTGGAMFHFGDAVVTLVLLPYAVLGTALFLLWTLRWLLAHGMLEKFRRLLADVVTLARRKAPPLPGASDDSRRSGGHVRKTADTKD